MNQMKSHTHTLTRKKSFFQRASSRSSQTHHHNCAHHHRPATIGYSQSEKERDGTRPLLTACANGHFKIVEYLLSQGADPSLTNNEGITPWRAAFNRHDDKGRACLKSLESTGVEPEVKEKCVVS